MGRARYYRSNRLQGLGERCHVSAYVPTSQMQKIADERTQGMVNYYVEAVRGLDFIGTLNALDTLARSCYMQGINDVLYAIENNPR